MTTSDVIVIGGGLHGCSTALHLAMRGVRARVIEKDHAGRHASGVNAGGVRRLGRHYAEIPLSVASMEMWHRIESLVDDHCGFESHGQVKVAENAEDMKKLEARVAEVCALGFTHEEIIGQAELREVVPSISPHCVGAIYCRADGAALPYRTTLAFKRKAVSLGAIVEEGVRVTGLKREADIWRVETSHGPREAPTVVNCAGAWAGRIAALVGEPVPLNVVAPMLQITAPLPPFIKPVLGAASRKLSFKQYKNGTVLIGGGHRGTPYPDENRTDLDWKALSVNLGIASDLFPIMAGAEIVRAWAGIEAYMPDEIPVMGPSRTSEGLYHAFGFTGHGFQLGPASGAVMAELAVTGRTNMPIAAFDIGRFAKARQAA